MFLAWMRQRRRQHLLETPFPEAWRDAIVRHMACWSTLRDDERRLLEQLVQVFVAEKSWEGCGGLELTDEIRVAIAAQACLLILALEHDMYRRVSEILVYPRTVVAPPTPRGFFDPGLRPVEAGGMPVLGQAFHRGPVILTWAAVQAGGENPRDGKNVVYHEFAHKLDMLTGSADGVPPLTDAVTYARWVQVFERSWHELHEQLDHGKPTFLDAYAGTSPAEFFAVATEQFFEQGRRMKRVAPDLYDVLQGFYRQDPASRG